MTEQLSNFKQYTADEIITLQREERKKVLWLVSLWTTIIILLLLITMYILIKYTYIDERLVYWLYLDTDSAGRLIFRK